MKTLFLVLILSAAAVAQHTVALTCTDTDLPNVTISFYRGSGQCSGNPTMVSVKTGQTTCSWTDSGMANGKYCYAATAVDPVSTLESAFSNLADVQVKPHAPTGLTGNQTGWLMRKDVDVLPYPAEEIPGEF